MRPALFDHDIDDADPNGLAATNSSAGAALTLDAALTSGGVYTSVDGLAHQLEIKDTSTKDQSGATFTVTGTDADGRAQTEAIVGPVSGATVVSTKHFSTVTSVAIASPVTAATVDMGTLTAGGAVSRTIPLDWREQSTPHFAFDITGTVDFTLQYTSEDVQRVFRTDGQAGALATAFQRSNQGDIKWFNDATIAAKTADIDGSVSSWPVQAARILYNSHSAGAEAQVAITQSWHR